MLAVEGSASQTTFGDPEVVIACILGAGMNLDVCSVSAFVREKFPLYFLIWTVSGKQREQSQCVCECVCVSV